MIATCNGPFANHRYPRQRPCAQMFRLPVGERRCERFSLELRIEQRGEAALRSEEHTSELQSLMRISYAVFCLKKKKKTNKRNTAYKQTTTQTQPTTRNK